MTRWLQHKAHANAEAREYIDECVSAKQIDPAMKKVAYSRLSYTQNLRRFSLFETSGGNSLLDLDHKVRAYLKMLGFLRCEAEVAKNIAAGSSNLDTHR